MNKKQLEKQLNELFAQPVKDLFLEENRVGFQAVECVFYFETLNKLKDMLGTSEIYMYSGADISHEYNPPELFGTLSFECYLDTPKDENN